MTKKPDGISDYIWRRSGIPEVLAHYPPRPSWDTDEEIAARAKADSAAHARYARKAKSEAIDAAIREAVRVRGFSQSHCEEQAEAVADGIRESVDTILKRKKPLGKSAIAKRLRKLFPATISDD
jgi:hypothetical protein